MELDDINCPKCKFKIPMDSAFCVECSTRIAKCKRCSTYSYGKYCLACGQELVYSTMDRRAYTSHDIVSLKNKGESEKKQSMRSKNLTLEENERFPRKTKSMLQSEESGEKEKKASFFSFQRWKKKEEKDKPQEAISTITETIIGIEETNRQLRKKPSSSKKNIGFLSLRGRRKLKEEEEEEIHSEDMKQDNALVNYSWYLPKYSRSEAEAAILNGETDFLLRESSMKGYYVISYMPAYKRKFKTNIVHQLIIQTNDRMWTWEDKNNSYYEFVFKDLPSLVQNFFNCTILTKEMLKPQLITSWMDSNVEFGDMPWNFGNISQKEAQALLSRIPSWSTKGLFIGRKTSQGFAICYLASQDSNGKYLCDEVQFNVEGNKIFRNFSSLDQKEEYETLGNIFSCSDFKTRLDYFLVRGPAHKENK